MGIDDDAYDRQKRVDGWNQDAVSKARCLVVGAGALGNELVKNLLQFGVREITLVDYDEIVAANLNRCCFFTHADVGAKKAEVIAREATRINPEAEVKVLLKRVEHLDEAIFSSVDYAFGCLDNVGARLHLNAQCYGKAPVIDGGTTGFNGRVSIVRAPSSCFECALSRRDYKLLWKKYACTGDALDFLDPKMPALPSTTSVIAGIQATEFAKLVHGRESFAGKSLYYDGLNARFTLYEVPKRKGCPVHA
jgi:molybdopterin/thiamine biosynthesis adenylyltransferase